MFSGEDLFIGEVRYQSIRLHEVLGHKEVDII